MIFLLLQGFLRTPVFFNLRNLIGLYNTAIRSIANWFVLFN
jgi:hypothetical protein